ncbi:MAG: leucine-rich repeat domain-containing protein [Bacteroides sp.]|nr:leucine-rich repeat domain-containing protein [Bacteroides sp.]
MRNLRVIFTALIVSLMSTSAFALLGDYEQDTPDPFKGCEMPSDIFDVDGVYYRVIDDEAHEVAVISLLDDSDHTYLGNYEELKMVPESVIHNGEEYTVVALVNTLFAYNEGVTVPENIRYMYGAFRNYEGSDLKIPAALIMMGNDCFENCNNLASIELPNSLLTIGDRCFTSDNALGKVTFGNNLIEIGAVSFALNPNLQEALLPNSVRKIGRDAFSHCSSLEKVKLPRYLPFAYRGDGTQLEMFNGCGNIRIIEWESETPMDLPNSFKQVKKDLCTVVVPDGYSQVYLESEYWSQFQIIEKSAYQTSIELPEISGEKNIDPKYYLLNGVQVKSRDNIEKGQPYISVEGNRNSKFIR